MYQFIRIEDYARKVSNNAGSSKSKNAHAKKSKWTARDVANEADRVVGNCDHVENPQPPKVLFGITPSQAVDFAESEVEKETVVVKMKNGKEAMRKVRDDKAILLAGVASYPADGTDYDKWQALTLDWLKNKYGGDLRSVVEHTDEEHPHLHFYVVADKPSQTREKHHDGHRAAKECVDTGYKKDAGKEYRSAMQQMLNKYWMDVGAVLGMARTGPKKTRLTREEWKAKQKDGAELANALAQAQTAQNAAFEAMKDLEARGAEVEKIAAQVAKINEMAALQIRLLSPEQRLARIVPAKVAQLGGTNEANLKSNQPRKP